MSRFKKVTAKDTEIIHAMADAVHWASQHFYHERGMDWRRAYQFICDDEAFWLLEEEIEQYFNGTHK